MYSIVWLFRFEADEILEVNTEADPELGSTQRNPDPEQGLIRITEQETETGAPFNQVPEKNWTTSRVVL